MTLLTALLFGLTSAMAVGLNSSDDYPIKYDELPAEAKTFIAKHFAKEEISHITIDKGILNDEYNVIFISGIKLEFSEDGKWTEIDCRYSSVPDNLVPEKIREYVATHYPKNQITELKRDYNEWEVKITGGFELTFNKDMHLVDIDD